MEQNNFWKIFSRRSAVCFFLIISLFLSCILRVAVIANSDYERVQLSQSSLKIKIANLRGTIFDRNLIPLTNKDKKIIACVSPTPRAVTAISSVLKGEELENVLARLKNGKPVTVEVDEIIECDGIVCTEVYTHNTKDTPAIHTLGYINADNKGVSGIEKAYDGILYSKSTVNISYTCDGLGNILEGIPPTLQNDTSVIAGGVVSTIDINFQNIVETAAQNIESGAVIVAESETNKIRGIASRPNFDCTNITEYLNKENSPLFNRTVSAYNVGSVFKPCVAVAGIENGYKDFTHLCTGSSEIIDRVFRCHKHDGHGITDLKGGIANSCNTYFYNFASKVGGDQIYKTARVFGFGGNFKICENFYTAKSTVPAKETLQNIARLANFSIGQGELTASPVSMLNLYSAIANGGKYYLPSVIEGTLQNGEITPYNIGSPTVAMKETTAEILKECLKEVVEEGTGTSAKPLNASAAGKTATAQTGKKQNGKEICSTWFCGFFPFESPKYTVIVFCENSQKQTKSCAEIFAQIADKITSLG